MRQSRLIGQVISDLSTAYGPAFDPDAIDAARFATHLRYFLTRTRTGAQVVDSTADVIGAALRDARPHAYQVALRVQELLELRLGTTVCEDETAYLTMHVARFEQSLGPAPPGCNDG